VIDLRKTIEPKSDQLNADDLIAGPIIATVRQVKRGPSEQQPVEIIIDGHRPYRPCLSMRRILIHAWGDKAENWLGKSMKLIHDPNVTYGGQAVGGIRIAELSDIDLAFEIPLTLRRGKRELYKVGVLTVTVESYPADEFDKNLSAWVNLVLDGKHTVPEIIQRASAKGQFTSEQIERLNQLTTGKGNGANS